MARRHGSSGYAGGCRCEACKDGKRQALRDRYRAIAYGRPTTDLTDASPVRQHLRSLMATGATLEQITRESGVSYGVLTRILYKGQRRVKANSSAALLNLRQVDVSSSSAPVDASGARRRAQALAVVGWPLVWQAGKVGSHPVPYGRMAAGHVRRVTASTVAAVRALYEEYWDQHPPESAAVRVARGCAARNGYLPPLAWDDALIDLPEDELAAEVARQVSAWDDAECAAAYRAHIKEGDRSPLMVAGASEYRRRSRERAKSRAAAA